MGRVGVAFRAFFRILGDARLAEHVDRLLRGERLATEPAPKPEAAKQELPKKEPVRNDALNLLSAMQREARLVDFLKEDLSGYADAQIGAAVRDVHRDCAAALERLFAVRPLETGGEGAEVQLPPGFDAGRYRLTGNVAGQPPFHGKLCHHGWLATKCELPAWTGNPAAAMIVAPAEVEIR